MVVVAPLELRVLQELLELPALESDRGWGHSG